MDYRTIPCLMCGTESTDAIEYTLIHSEAQVCAYCANIVANVYSKKHSDQYLTWPNEPFRDDLRPRKRITATVRKQVMERDKYRCVKCESHIDLQLDHIYPHIRGGSDEPDNLQTLCGPCNRIKKDRIEEAA